MKTAQQHYHDRGRRDGLAGKPMKRPSDQHYRRGYAAGTAEREQRRPRCPLCAAGERHLACS